MEEYFMILMRGFLNNQLKQKIPKPLLWIIINSPIIE